MDVACDELTREIEVVVELVLALGRVGDIARVRDRGLDHAAAGAHRVDAELQVVDVVERVEDTEDVHAVAHRDVAELEDGIVGVVGVTDAIGTAEEHLEGDVGHSLTHHLQPLPRTLSQEAEADVEGGATPILERVALVERVRRRRGNGQDVLGTHPRREQRLVRVTPGGVRDEQSAPLADRLGKGFGPTLLQHLLQAAGRRHLWRLWDEGHDTRRDVARRAERRAAVDHEVTQIVEQLLAAVVRHWEVEELGRICDEGRGCSRPRGSRGGEGH